MLTLLTAFLAVASASPTNHVARASPPSYGGSTPSVTVKNGTVTGVHSTTYNEDLFLGIPFAQPPVGELRFRVPQSINSTFNGTYAADAYAPECVGYGGDQLGYPISEDCLYLNVIRPSGYENQQLPVGVWIHGGGLYEGGTRDERYNLSFIVDNSVKIGKPIIAVSIAYRLSGWGFLSSQQVTGSGNTNLGLRDQRLALHWVQENIAGFGGDASKVTIWGESAGAGSVGWHLTAYNGRDDGLFWAGIMESGNPVNYNSYRDEGDYQPAYDALVELTSCANVTDTLDCLRQAPYEIIDNYFNTTTPNTWLPVVDGDFIARWASIQLAEGAFVHVPVIDGANTDEGTAFGHLGINTVAEFIEVATNSSTQAFFPAALADSFLEAFPDIPANYIPPVAEIGNYTYDAAIWGALYRWQAGYFGDAVMIANRRGTCQTWAANGLDAYCYRFNTIPNGIAPDTYGVTHFQEVAFVFDNTEGYGYNALHGTVNPFADKPKSYTELAYLMSSSWASFIHDRNPNGWYTRHNGTPSWPVYDNANPQNIVWDANATALAYAEPDTFRKESIQWILDHAIAFSR